MARHALHQRSASDANLQLPFPGSASNSSSSSSKPPRHVSRSSTSSTKNSKRHKSQSSSSTTGSAVRSIASLDSLPPVPPLRIQKQRISIYQDPDIAATNSYALASTHVADTYTSSDEGPQNRQSTPPRDPTLPRSILKKPSKASLPLYTEDDYRQQSSAWVSREAALNEYRPHRARMNAHTLRIVDDTGSDLAAPRDEDDRPAYPYPPESSAQGGARGYIRRVESRPGRSRSGTTTSEALSSMSGRPTTPLNAKQFPDWARYFYGSKGGRASIIISPQIGPDQDQIGRTISSPPEQRPKTGGSMSISELPRFFMRPPGPREPDETTLWSLPHLDHLPLKRIENLDRQLLLFCFGFVLPLCWWIAAFLPLPDLFPSWHSQHDLEARAANLTVSKEARQLEMAYERRFANARWWRRVNRGMSVIGLVIIGVIVALVIASHAP